MYYDVHMFEKSPENIRYLIIIFFCGFISFFFIIKSDYIFPKPEIPVMQAIPLVPYTGQVYHIFFHSLIIYPEMAFHDEGKQSFKDYMITRTEFEKILPQLYTNNFILVDSSILYRTNPDGTISKKEILLPEGKRPLIISIDDVNYQTDRDNKGFAKRLVLDSQGDVATEVVTPTGEIIVTSDGDVMPIIDDFVKLHPDFSFNGAKGIIAETGFDGVFGYRTNIASYQEREKDIESIKAIVKRLRETGWQFASHSYSHEMPFRTNTLTLDQLKYDTDRWDTEVRPFVGNTDIFIGPFGQIFKDGDPRRDYLLSKGFKIFYGVGMDLYLEYFPKYLIMNRADIDGIRLTQSPSMLYEYFDPTSVIDPARGN